MGERHNHQESHCFCLKTLKKKDRDQDTQSRIISLSWLCSFILQRRSPFKRTKLSCGEQSFEIVWSLPSPPKLRLSRQVPTNIVKRFKLEYEYWLIKYPQSFQSWALAHQISSCNWNMNICLYDIFKYFKPHVISSKTLILALQTVQPSKSNSCGRNFEGWSEYVDGRTLCANSYR